jgi:phosphate transport system protein
MANEHIVKSFDEELEALERMVTQMGGMAEAQLSDCIIALSRRDSALSAVVVTGDAKVDEMNWAVDEAVVRVLALRQPMALDLRAVIGALRIAGDLERIGDYAANVAKRTMALSHLPIVSPVQSIPRMGKLVQHIVKEVLDAYTEKDAAKAERVWERDAEVDEIYTSLFRETLTYMMEDPRNITPCTHAMFMAKNIERIGDHATNIAETVFFIVNGTPLMKRRPKGDESAYSLGATAADYVVSVD